MTNRDAIIGLYRARMYQNPQFIKFNIDRPKSGHPRSSRTEKKNIKAVRERVWRDPKRSNMI